MLEQITPLILTYNESPNINRTLAKLTWAKRIVIIDSFSDDGTLEIISQYLQVEIFQRKFDTHAMQWNFGLEKIKTEWVLSLDADYTLSDQLILELEKLQPPLQVDGYFVGFKYCVFGKPLRGTILPPRQLLFRHANASYTDDGHTQLLKVKNQSRHLSSFIYHDDHKSLSRWLWAQHRYHEIEANKLINSQWNELSIADKVRTLKIISPFAVLIYCLIIKGGILDGLYGWYYAFQRVLAEIDISLRLIEHSFSNNNHKDKEQ